MAATGRPLREVFSDVERRRRLAEDPQAVLREAGHPDLPSELVAQSVVSFADTAPVEVAEHLASFVVPHSPAGDPAEAGAGAGGLAAGFDLLASAPEPAELVDPVGSGDGVGELSGTLGHGVSPPESGAGFGAGQVSGGVDGPGGSGLDMAFGRGDVLAPDPVPPAAAIRPEVEPAPGPVGLPEDWWPDQPGSGPVFGGPDPAELDAQGLDGEQPPGVDGS